jgi:putative FmdB family regulatory protein
MPRYRYQCTQCDQETEIFHLSDEVVSECPKCEIPETLIKILTGFTTSKKTTRKPRTGEITEDFIKEATLDLKQQKKDSLDKR